MKTQSEYEQAIKELNHWKECLKLIGETPEQVYESWRTRQIKMFKYIRLMTAWRNKYNFLLEKYLQNIQHYSQPCFFSHRIPSTHVNSRKCNSSIQICISTPKIQLKPTIRL